jgi:hypothetical protein
MITQNVKKCFDKKNNKLGTLTNVLIKKKLKNRNVSKCSDKKIKKNFETLKNVS